MNRDFLMDNSSSVKYEVILLNCSKNTSLHNLEISQKILQLLILVIPCFLLYYRQKKCDHHHRFSFIIGFIKWINSDQKIKQINILTKKKYIQLLL